MHRYREFGLYSEADELLRRAFRDGFKRNGITFPAFLDALAWYRDRVRPGADEASLVDAFSEFAAERGWTTEQRDAVLDVYRAVRDEGPGAVIAAEPRPDQDRVTLARAEEVLRGDPARYWADAELQDAVFEARERLGSVAPPEQNPRSAPQADADRRRVGEIERLLRDPSGAGQQRYWTDTALREDYAHALERLHDSATAPRVEPQPGSADGSATLDAGA